ncbi:MAG: hypothetical protein ACKO9S_07865, partial [Bacteroidota bacterium]
VYVLYFNGIRNLINYFDFFTDGISGSNLAPGSPPPANALEDVEMKIMRSSSETTLFAKWLWLTKDRIFRRLEVALNFGCKGKNHTREKVVQ